METQEDSGIFYVRSKTWGRESRSYIYTLYLIEVELPTYRSYVDTLEDYLFNYAFYHKSWEVCIMLSSRL